VNVRTRNKVDGIGIQSQLSSFLWIHHCLIPSSKYIIGESERDREGRQRKKTGYGLIKHADTILGFIIHAKRDPVCVTRLNKRVRSLPLSTIVFTRLSAKKSYEFSSIEMAIRKTWIDPKSAKKDVCNCQFHFRGHNEISAFFWFLFFLLIHVPDFLPLEHHFVRIILSTLFKLPQRKKGHGDKTL